MFAGQFEQGPSLGDNFNMTHPLFQLVAKLNNLRRLYPALQTGVQSNLWSDASGPGLFAYTRRLGTQEVFVVFNTANTNQILPPCPTIYPAGTRLVNLLDETETATVRGGGQTPPIVVPGTSAKIFSTQAFPLDPVVTAISPAHDAKEISPTVQIVVHFSQLMDASSVERAFSTIPPVKGKFVWSEAHDELTFTPVGQGFNPQTLVTVRIGDTAHAANFIRKFYAGFESRFRCGRADSPLPPN
jgi:hypothetical protein